MARKKAPKKPDLSYIAPGLHPMVVAIDTVAEDPNNARLHGELNTEAIKRSLATFGQRIPLVVRESTMQVSAGNGRLKAMHELGWKHVAVLKCDDDEITARAFALADNRTGELAEWDYLTLNEQLSALEGLVDVENLGFTIADMTELAGFTDPDKVDPNKIGNYTAADETFSIRIPGVKKDDIDKLVELVTAAIGDGYEINVV